MRGDAMCGTPTSQAIDGSAADRTRGGANGARLFSGGRRLCLGAPERTPCRRAGCSDYNALMDRQGLYRLLQPGTPGIEAWLWRITHHAMVAAGIAIALAL